MVYWTDFDYSRLENITSNKYRRDHKYSPIIGAFDLESTNYHNIFAFMYVWQFGVGDQIAYGRTWGELREFIANIKAAMHINYHHKLIVFDHNLKFDFGFFKRELPIDGEIIAKSTHEIILCTVFDCLEFRDSYQYTEKSLDAMGEEIGYRKLKGYDYSKIRHAGTDLTSAELSYCERDIEILLHYYGRELEEAGSTRALALTATQRVKKVLSAKMQDMDGRGGLMLGMIRKRQLKPESAEDMQTLRRLRVAFFGGVNYCTTMYKGELLADVDDYDADSHYIAQILLHKFPKNKFTPIPVPVDQAGLQDLINHNGAYHNKAMLITFSFKQLEAVLDDFAFLPIYSKNYIAAELADRRSMVSHKMHSMGAGTMTLTDIDFFLLTKYYTVDKIKILEVLGSDYGVLPDYIVNTCTELYINKKAAKKRLKQIKKMREPTAEEQAEYDLIKSFLNRIYGIFVQDPVRTNYIFKNGSVCVDPKDRITTKKTQFSPVLYQWGVWVSAWARYELLLLFANVCRAKTDAGKQQYTHNVLYMDTDSIKGKNLDHTIIAQYNKNVKRRVFEFCRKKRINPELLDGLGEFERTHYDYFKANGLKQYAYITDKGDFVYHISGLARPKEGEDGKEHCYFDRFDTLAEKMDAFDMDMVVEPEDSGLLKSIFGGEREPEEVTDYQGKTATVKVLSYVLLLPRGFRSGDELPEVIADTDPERLGLVFEKFGHLSKGVKV